MSLENKLRKPTQGQMPAACLFLSDADEVEGFGIFCPGI
jgi:hypothetical protein